MVKTLFITGKGGVGKSVVTASLATTLASLKHKTAVIELNQARMADLFESSLPDYDGTPINNYLTLFNLTPSNCFQEYATRILPKRILFFLKNRWVHHFLDAVPGLNEILFLGKMVSMMEEEQFDFLLVDAPATGHTLALCDAPQTALKVIKSGALKATLENILTTLHDPRQTQFLLVTQLEDFIVQETIELHDQLKQKFKISIAGLIINAVRSEKVIPAIWKSFLRKQESSGSPLSRGGIQRNHLDPRFRGDNKTIPKPLIDILQWAFHQNQKEETLTKRIKKEIPLERERLPWLDNIKKEKEVRMHLAKLLKPWVSQNLLKKSA